MSHFSCQFCKSWIGWKGWNLPGAGHRPERGIWMRIIKSLQDLRSRKAGGLPRRNGRRKPPDLERLEERRVLSTSGYLQLNLVSDQATTALVQDAKLVAPWGTALNPNAGAFWVADKSTGVATQYSGDVAGSPFAQNALVVNIPGGSPTGVAFNGTANFMISSGATSGPATFLFDADTDQVSGWNQNVPAGSTQAIAAASTPAADYKGLAVAFDSSINGGLGGNLLYATNFHAGTVDVFNSSFQLISLGSGAFKDASIPSGFAPFNIENLGGQLYVTYAKQDGAMQNDVPGSGNGYVDIFNANGTLVKSLIAGGALNSPYGVALAPANFGDWSNDLLVANSGDGLIHAFNPSTGAILGTLTTPGSAPISIPGLKDLQFGNGQTAGDANKLFFSADSSNGQHGLFGSLESALGENLTAEGARFAVTANVPFTGVVATFADRNGALTAGNFNATINWGDGTTGPGTVVALTGGGFGVTGTHTFTHTGTFNAPVTISDLQSHTSVASAQAVVTFPPLLLVGTTVTPTEGVSFQGTVATFSDADGNMFNTAAYTATILWGDGSSSTGTITPNGAGFDIRGSHSYAEEGTDTITVSLADTDGASASINSTANVADAPLTASGAMTIATTEGTSFTRPVATFFDTDPNGTLSDYSATIQWGDGNSSNGSISSFGFGFTVTGTHTYADEGTFTATVTIADVGGSTATASTTATVADADVLAGTAAAVSATEGKAVTSNLATFSDVYTNSADDFIATINWGDGTTDTGTVTGSGGAFTVNGDHAYADEGAYLVSVVLADDSPGTAVATVSFTLSVADADVLAATLASLSPTEGLAFSGNVATVSDTYSGADADDFTASIDWGDGTTNGGSVTGGSVVGGGSAFTVGGSHTYAEEGTYNAVVTFTDDSPGTASATATGSVVVIDAPLTASQVTIAGTDGVTMSNITVATFTDADPNGSLGDYTASIDWGDGTSTAGTVAINPNGGFEVDGTHAYTQGGNYTVAVAISDTGGAAASVSSTANIADWPLIATGTTIAGTEGSQVSVVVATFIDTNPAGGSLDKYAATIDWGDGQTTGGSVTGSGANYTVNGTHTFGDEGTFSATITIVEVGGATATASTEADVADADVFSAASPLTLTVTEGASMSATVATFTDQYTGNTPADFTAQIVWGDGSTTTGTVSGSGANYTVSGSHAYAEEGTYTAQATLSDDDGGNSGIAAFSVDVADPAVSATGGYAFTAVEGATAAAQTVATFTDPGGPEPIVDYSATIDWGDGSSSSGAISFDTASGIFTVSASHLYGAEGSDTVTVTIKHDVATAVSVSSTATVRFPPVDATGGYAFAAVEGATAAAQTVATFTDPGGAEPTANYTATIDWGDGTSASGAISFDTSSGVFTVAASHLYAEEGADTVTVSISHASAATATVTSSATVSDPSVVATGGYTFAAVEGATAAVQTVATFTDPGGPEATADYSATIKWGDGATTAGVISFDAASGVFTVAASHPYSEEGLDTITVAIGHDAATAVAVTSTATVTDPAVIATGGYTFSAVEGATAAAQTVATFTDPAGPESTTDYSATIVWGDGSSSAGVISVDTVSGIFTVSASHLYAEEGGDTVSVKIDHESATAVSVTSTASVADPAVNATGGYTFSAAEGATATSQTVATFTDPGGPESTADYSATIQWGDGSSSAGAISFDTVSGVFTVSASHLYMKEGTDSITVTIGHDAATAVGVSSTAAVTDPPVVATGALTFTAVEGATAAAQAVATFTDPGGAEAISDYSATIDWGDGNSSVGSISFNSTSQVFTVSGSHLFAEEGADTLTVTIGHDAATAVSVTSTAIVSDPAVNATPVTATVVAGASSVPVATFTDPGGAEPVGDYSASVVWGDGTTVVGTITFDETIGKFTVSAAVPADLDTSTEAVPVTIAHETAPSTTVTSQITATEAPIFMTAVAVTGREFLSLTNVTVATFTHLGNDAAGEFTATIDWGDGTTTAGTVVAPNYTVVGTHTYEDEGTYAVRVTVSEQGVSASVTGSAQIGQELLPIADQAHPTANELYVAEVYTDVLLRRVDSGGLQFWAGQLDAGMARTDFTSQLTHSAEYYANIIIRPAYEHFLGRDFDAKGLAFWVGQMQQGLTDEQLEAGFIGSDEYFNHAGGTNTLWVDAMYEDLLGRAPDSQGEAFWVGQLAAGESRSAVALGFAASPERETKRITQDYVDFLDRFPTPSEVDSWVQEFEHGVTNEDVITAFVASDEYYDDVQAIGP